MTARAGAFLAITPSRWLLAWHEAARRAFPVTRWRRDRAQDVTRTAWLPKSLEKSSPPPTAAKWLARTRLGNPALLSHCNVQFETKLPVAYVCSPSIAQSAKGVAADGPRPITGDVLLEGF
jgi:hypothetical protein